MPKKKSAKRLLVAATAVLVLAGFQCIQASTPPTVRALKTEAGPKVDGFLDDRIWEGAVLVTGFKMVEPNPNVQPSEKTELRVIYDRDNLYLGIHCLDSEPSKISGQTMAHDAFGDERSNDDLIRVLLDPFQDKRNAYVFFVNPRGARSEGLAYGELFRLDWDGIWDAKSRILIDGWSVEIRIPFKTLSFNPRLECWGINVERYIPRKLETIRLSGTNRDSYFYNAMEAARLEGIAGIGQGRGITLRPFGKGTASHDYESVFVAKEGLDGGLDIHKDFRPNLAGVLSYNTDFAETEVDERKINLTRFPLFFPEKRTFFLEGSEIFNFGPTAASSTSFIPFFSRRIGTYEGRQIPLLFGSKVYGKTGSTSFNLLDVQTKRFSEFRLAGDNFFAGRIYQNIWAESKVGLIFTNGEPSGKNNQLLGFDFTYRTSRFHGNKNFLAGVWSARSWSDQNADKPYGFGFKIGYPNDLWDVFLSYNYYGDALNPGLGFLPRNNIQWLVGKISYSPRPEKGWIGESVRQLRFMLGPVLYWDLEGRLESYEIWISPLSVHTENGSQMDLSVIPKRDVLPYDFEPSEGVAIPKGAYDFTSFQLKYSSPSYHPFSFSVEYDFGEFYSGTLNEAKIGLSYKFRGLISLTFASDLVRGKLPQGNFDENVYQLNADIFISPNLGLMNDIQYDSASRNLGLNVRFRWQVSPGNEIYLVYSKSWERRWNPRARFFPIAEYGILKIQFSIRP